MEPYFEYTCSGCRVKLHKQTFFGVVTWQEFERYYCDTCYQYYSNLSNYDLCSYDHIFKIHIQYLNQQY
jgi:hypothetical protein